MVDDDGASSPDLIGSVETTLGKIMGSRQQVFEHGLGAAHKGNIVVRAEAINTTDAQNYAKFKLKW